MCWLSTPPAFYPQYCCPQTARFLLEKFVKSGPVTLRLSSTTFFSQLHPPLLQGLHRDGFRRFLETRICVALFNKDKKYLPLQPVISESIICMSSAMYITDCPADLRSERVRKIETRTTCVLPRTVLFLNRVSCMILLWVVAVGKVERRRRGSKHFRPV